MFIIFTFLQLIQNREFDARRVITKRVKEIFPRREVWKRGREKIQCQMYIFPGARRLFAQQVRPYSTESIVFANFLMAQSRSILRVHAMPKAVTPREAIFSPKTEYYSLFLILH